MAGTAARCKSITLGAKTYKDPVSCSIVQDDELIEKMYSDSTFPVYFGGREVLGITFTSADKDIVTDFQKGTQLDSDLVVVIEGSLNSEGTIDAATAITATLSGGMVTEMVQIESTTDGAPIEYTVTCMAFNDAGTPGTLVVS